MVRSHNEPEPPPLRRRTARTAEEREDQLINLAINEAERQITKGIATSQIITHYLKLATEREKAELARIHGEVELQKAKIEAMANQARQDQQFKEALAAFRGYQGLDVDDEE